MGIPRSALDNALTAVVRSSRVANCAQKGLSRNLTTPKGRVTVVSVAGSALQLLTRLCSGAASATAAPKNWCDFPRDDTPDYCVGGGRGKCYAGTGDGRPPYIGHSAVSELLNVQFQWKKYASRTFKIAIAFHRIEYVQIFSTLASDYQNIVKYPNIFKAHAILGRTKG
ncbi:hypothetical protein EVAR_21626_1 [Eumeta japonica]|uniref:Uncharacterized protein n=1 Tax=Eumeta variegata TaxID=151549 RepID=A0A4C1UXK2_EUMVA|nr:hypothetical protein EVAR_21626_1 [Eumeta japonica]